MAPRVTILTPSYQQARWLDAAMRSVLDQGFPDLEYVVVDGGSTDGSVEVIRGHAGRLARWTSERDGGQAAALNRGLERASGDVVGWLNADDLLEPGSLARVAEAHAADPDAILAGDAVHFVDGGAGEALVRARGLDLGAVVDCFRPRFAWSQPATFFPRALLRALGPLDETLRFSFDRDLLCRALSRARVRYVGGAPLARFRLHAAQKTAAHLVACREEDRLVTRRYLPLVPGLDARAVLASHELELASVCGASASRAPREGIAHLAAAVRQDPAVLAGARFWRVAAKLAAPRALVARWERGAVGRLRG